MGKGTNAAQLRWEAIVRSWEAAMAKPCMRRWRSLAEMIEHAARLDDGVGLHDLAIEARRMAHAQQT